MPYTKKDIISIITVLIVSITLLAILNVPPTVPAIINQTLTVVLYIICFIATTLSFVAIAYVIYTTLANKKLKHDNNETNLLTNEGKLCNTKYKKFLSTSERDFKEILQSKLPPTVEIYCNVAIRSILEENINSTLDMDNWDDRTIAMQYVDYAIIVKKTERIILVIELDGKSHNTPKAQKNDALKDNILKKSNIPIKRVPEHKKNDPAMINSIITFCISQTAERNKPST